MGRPRLWNEAPKLTVFFNAPLQSSLPDIGEMAAGLLSKRRTDAGFPSQEGLFILPAAKRNASGINSISMTAVCPSSSPSASNLIGVEEPIFALLPRHRVNKEESVLSFMYARRIGKRMPTGETGAARTNSNRLFDGDAWGAILIPSPKQHPRAAPKKTASNRKGESSTTPSKVNGRSAFIPTRALRA